MMASSAAFTGARTDTSDTTDFNAHSFLIKQILAAIPGAGPVIVKAVTNAGGVAAVGYVDVQPLINQIDGNGVATPHGIIHNVPYARLQGGTNAVIMDPQVGDIGIAVFCDRDISVLKATKAVSNPGSRRKNDWADGVYLGAILNGTPSQYIQFSASGIAVTSPNQVTVTAPNISMVAATQVTITVPNLVLNANIQTNGTMTNNGTDIGNGHLHSGVQTGTGDTGPPI